MVREYSTELEEETSIISWDRDVIAYQSISHALKKKSILVKRGQGFRQDIRLGGDGGSRSLEVIWNRSHPDSVDGYIRKVQSSLAYELGFQEIIHS